ncbi:MAG: hypothetical protein CUN55_05565 [Phototrophicales bacterium]|nr:MAG: hypothetical protein CUN55_05565 [Phototrophicales bacterium]
MYRSFIGIISSITLIVVLIAVPINSMAQQPNPSPTPAVGTRVPPTKVPIPTSAAVQTTTVTYSGIATMQNEGILRVGTRFNLPPFAWLDETGQVVGYEADIVRAIAAELGIEAVFIQVTTETELQMLRSGEVDILIGEQLKAKHNYEYMNFTHTYYDNRQKMVIRESDQGLYPNISALSNQRIGIVAGSRGEEAINIFSAYNGVGFELVRYLSQDAALDALEKGEVTGVVGEWDDLNRAGRLGMSYVPQDVQIDLYAIAMRRYDVNLRNLLNRTLQRLSQNGTLSSIAANWFPDRDPINFAAFIPIYNNLTEDARTLSDFPPDIPLPARSIIEKIQAKETLVVSGLDLDQSPLYYDGYLDPINRAIIEEMARRWGVNVTFIPGSVESAVDLVATNQADIAIGVRPRWDGADRVEYSVPYFYTGHRILVLETSQYDTFEDFRRGSWIGYFQDSPQDGEYLESLGGTFSVYRFADSLDARRNFDSRDVDGLYADAIRLLAFMEEYSGYPWLLQSKALGPNPFQPITIASPRNDVDFALLINWTLSDMYYDGTLERLWRQFYDIDKWLTYGIDARAWIPFYPGIGDFLYNKLN